MPSKKYMIIVLIAVVLLLVAGAGYLIYATEKSPSVLGRGYDEKMRNADGTGISATETFTKVDDEDPIPRTDFQD